MRCRGSAYFYFTGLGDWILGSDVAHEFAFQIVQGCEDAPDDDVALDLCEPQNLSIHQRSFFAAFRISMATNGQAT